MQVRYVPVSPTDRDFIAQALADASFRAGHAADPSVAGMRDGTAVVAAHRFVRQPLPDVQVEPQTWAGVPCEMLTPARPKQDRLIVYLHGGGFVRGSLALGRANASVIAHAASTRVLAIGYRQAPEHPFPAAADDVAAVMGELYRTGTRPASVAVVGESSGGCLALGLAVLHRERSLPLPAGIAALAPMTDLALRGASWEYNAAQDVADRATAQRLVGLYLGDADPDQPLASPIQHDFIGCCPLLIGIGSHETMLSDAEYLARHAFDAGVAVRLDVYEGMPHGFTRFDCEAGKDALEEAATWCRGLLN